MDTLTPEQIDGRLRDLDGWSHADGALHRTFEFDGFLDAIAFVNRVAAKADAADHHPELRNVYRTVEVTLTTHSAGGVTEKDLALAAEIDAAAAGDAEGGGIGQPPKSGS